MSEKDPFPPDRQAFPFRALELYGIVLGAGKLLAFDSDGKAWLTGVLRRLESATVAGPWAKAIGRLAATHLGAMWSDAWPTPEGCTTLEELAALRWIASAGEYAGQKRFDPRRIDEMLLSRAIEMQIEPADVARAAVLFHALRRATHERLQSDLAATWQIALPTRDATELVVALCRRFPLIAKQILKRREKRPTLEIKDEYDVQDLMRGILKLHFDDVREEEWAPSYAGKASRIDFVLKKEQVVVETKMTRANLNQKDVGDELIIDKERYRTHPDCKTLVCFVYDPDGRCHNPDALECDLSISSGDYNVVVVVVPKGF